MLFLGHGSPMNAISDNEFTNGWKLAAKSIPRPDTVVCISAHWETSGTFVTAMNKPPTIHDFYGFPGELFAVQYPAPGNPGLAEKIRRTIPEIELDFNWGLDHGCWSVLTHLFPNADVPVIQMSLDCNKTPQAHYELAKELTFLRNENVLIIGSGNIVHNLRMMEWNSDSGFDWAVKANELLKTLIAGEEHRQLTQYQTLGTEVQLSVPTPEHYLPLLYVLALKDKNETVSFFNDTVIYGSISMTSLTISGS